MSILRAASTGLVHGLTEPATLRIYAPGSVSDLGLHVPGVYADHGIRAVRTKPAQARKIEEAGIRSEGEIRLLCRGTIPDGSAVAAGRVDVLFRGVWYTATELTAYLGHYELKTVRKAAIR